MPKGVIFVQSLLKVISAWFFIFLKTFKIHDVINYKVEHFNLSLHIFILVILEIGTLNIARTRENMRGRGNHIAGLHVSMLTAWKNIILCHVATWIPERHEIAWAS